MNLKQKLEYHYKSFDFSQLEPDPLQFLHLFKDENDIEVMGFVSSVFAYGSVRQIINTLNRFLRIANNKPYAFIMNYHSGYQLKLSHRFYTEEDVKDLFISLHNSYEKYGSLKNLFYSFYELNNANLKNSISDFSSYFLNEILSRKKELTRGVKFIFPLPEKGSACKRMNLFLRWMVRKDKLDFGLWDEISPSKLIIPVDTHVARICKQLKLTNRKNVSWKMAEEITNNLRKFDPDDPVKYDFAICHIGMRKMKF